LKTIIATMSLLTAAGQLKSDIGLFVSIHVVSINSEGITLRYGAAVVLLAWILSSKISSILKSRGKKL